MLIDELLRLDQGTGEAVRIVTIDTGVLFEETLQTWRAFEQRFGVEIEVVDASSAGRSVERARALLLGRQGRGARTLAGRRRGLDHGHPPRAGADAREGRADRTRRGSRPVEVQPAGALERQGPVAADQRARPSVQRAARPGLRVDRLRAVHAARQRSRGPLGRHRQDRVWAARRSRSTRRPDGRRGTPEAEPPAGARVRGDSRDARGRGRIRAAGAAVQRRQGLDRAAAAGREGVSPGAVPVSADARRHRAQLSRGDRVPRPPRRRARRAADRRERAGVDRQRTRRRGDAGRARRAISCRR